MRTRTDFIVTELECKEALEEFEQLSDPSAWLLKYSSLFDLISIQPPGLPRIFSVHFEGEYSESIALFGKLYEKVQPVL